MERGREVRELLEREREERVEAKEKVPGKKIKIIFKMTRKEVPNGGGYGWLWLWVTLRNFCQLARRKIKSGYTLRSR